eukprot:EG_transcript_27101
MALQALVELFMLLSFLLFIAGGISQIIGHRFSLLALLSVPIAWIVLVFISVFSGELPRVLHMMRLPFVGPEVQDQYNMAVRALLSHGVAFSQKHLTPTTVLLMALLLMLAFGISCVLHELREMREALAPRRGQRAKAE